MTNYDRPADFLVGRMALLHTMTDDDRAWIHAIEESAYKRFGVPLSDVFSKRKSRDVAEARQYIAVRLRATTKLSYPQLATLYGGHHSTYVLMVNRWREAHPLDNPYNAVAEL